MSRRILHGLMQGRRWSKVKIKTNKDSFKVGPYAMQYALEANILMSRKHVPREISRHVYFFIKKEEGLSIH